MQISASYRKQDAANNANNQEIYVLSSYYCGTGVGRDAVMSNNLEQDGKDEGTGIISDGPFILTFNADMNPGVVMDATNMQQQSEAMNELGFSLDYRLSTSCPDLTFANAV